MVGAGLLAMILGSLDYWRNMRAIRKQDPSVPRSLASVLAAFILVVGVLFFADCGDSPAIVSGLR
jgi:uncharacterized membrane protein YidH (DUF202 family)